MNRPCCLVGSIESARNYINNQFVLEECETLVLSDDMPMEDLKNFRIFLEMASIKLKVGIIYNFGALSISKQSLLLKIFESLLDGVRVFIHSFYHVNFTIHTRCNVVYLPCGDLQDDLVEFNKIFISAIKTKTFSGEMLKGLDVLFSTLNLYNLDLLSKIEKDCILESLR